MFNVVNDKYKTVGPENELGLRRIQAVRSFGDVKEGDIGGYIQDERNLSDRGTCWIYDDAQVMGKSMVRDDATIRGNAVVKGESRICDDAVIDGNVSFIDSDCFDAAVINCNGTIDGYCNIHGRSHITGNIDMNNVDIDGRATIEASTVQGEQVEIQHSRLHDSSHVCGAATLQRVHLHDECMVTDAAKIRTGELYGNSVVSGNSVLSCTNVSGNVSIAGHSTIESSEISGQINIDGDSNLDNCKLNGNMTINDTVLCNQNVDGSACYRNGVDVQNQRETLASDILNVDDNVSSLESLPCDVIF